MANSPTVQISDGGTALGSVSTGTTVTAGNLQTIALVSTIGVVKWDCQCIFTTDTNTPPRPNASGQVLFTPATAGLGYVFKSQVSGQGGGNEQFYYFGVYVTDIGGAKIVWPTNSAGWAPYLQSLNSLVAPQFVENAAAQVNAILYGDGSDGACTFDGTNTFAFASKAGSVYTLTRDTYLGTGSMVNNGVTIKTAGFRVFCNGQLTVNSGGLIINDGNAGSGTVQGAA